MFSKPILFFGCRLSLKEAVRIPSAVEQIHSEVTVKSKDRMQRMVLIAGFS